MTPCVTRNDENTIVLGWRSLYWSSSGAAPRVPPSPRGGGCCRHWGGLFSEQCQQSYYQGQTEGLGFRRKGRKTKQSRPNPGPTSAEQLQTVGDFQASDAKAKPSEAEPTVFSHLDRPDSHSSAHYFAPGNTTVGFGPSSHKTSSMTSARARGDIKAGAAINRRLCRL
jgi:hypothetical protein